MYQGWFLNLERNEARRCAITRHLAERGAAERYQRFEAIDGRAVADQYVTELDPGCLGLWLTHIKLLEAQRGTPVHLHIIEDDTIVANNLVKKLDQLLEQADRLLPNWDFIFTDVFVATADVDVFRLLNRLIQECEPTSDQTLIDLQTIHWAATSSLLVNRNSVDKFAGLIANQWTQPLPLDLYLRDLVSRGLLSAYLTVPFMTSISRDSQQSDIRGAVSRSLAVASAYRRSFFQEADLPAILSEIQELTKDAENPSLLRAIYLRTLLYRISDQWEHF